MALSFGDRNTLKCPPAQNFASDHNTHRFSPERKIGSAPHCFLVRQPQCQRCQRRHKSLGHIGLEKLLSTRPTNSRLERFTHAMSRMQATAAESILNAARNPPRMFCSSPIMRAPSPGLSLRELRNRSLMTSNSACACAIFTEGFRTPMAKSVFPHYRPFCTLCKNQ